MDLLLKCHNHHKCPLPPSKSTSKVTYKLKVNLRVYGNFLNAHYYRPHSEGCGKVIFSVCVSVHTSTGGGGIPTPFPFRPGKGYPTPCQDLGRGYPPPSRTGMGVPPSRPEKGAPPSGQMPGRGGGVPPAGTS